MRRIDRATVRCVLCTVFPLILTAASGARDWSGYRGPNGNGSIDVDVGQAGLDRRWIRPIGSGYAGIAVAEHVIVTSFTSGDSDVVAAFEIETGAEAWREVLGPAYQGHDGSHDGPLATPLIADGKVFAIGARGELAALALSDGREVWRRNLQEELSAPKPWYGFTSSPVHVDGRIIVQIGGPDGALVALQADTGDLAWRSVDDAIAYQSPVVAELGGRRQVVFAGMATVAGVDPADGSILWSYRHQGGGGMGAWSLSPIPVGKDRLFLTHDDHASTLLEIVVNEGGMSAEQVWHGKALSRSYSPATVSADRVCGFVARYLSCADLESGQELWRSRSPGDGFLIALGRQLAVLTKKGNLHIGTATAEGWVEGASVDVFDDLAWTPPSFSKGRVFVRSLGHLARVDVVDRSDARALGDAPSEPEEIAELRRAVSESDSPRSVVDAFLRERELPIINGEEVIFVWRGAARDVGIGGDMIGARRDEPMTRVDGTDLWWWSGRIEPATRLSYVFFVDYVPTVDPRNPRRVTGTLLGPNMDTREGGMDMSWFATPGWHEPAYLQAGPDESRSGALVDVQVTVERPADEEGQQPTALDLPARVWLPPGYESSEDRVYPTLYVLGPGALAEGKWSQALDRLVDRQIEPAIVVFFEAPRTVPPPLTLAALTDELLPLIDQRFRTDQARRGVVGHGGSSRFAFELTFSNPDLFDRVAAQSFFLIEIQARSLEAALGELTAEERPLRIYLDWAKYDLRSPHEAWDMVETARDWDATLRSRGWNPIGGEARDGTDWGSWRNRTHHLLKAMFPLDEDIDAEQRPSTD